MDAVIEFLVFLANLVFFIWFGNRLNSINRHLQSVNQHLQTMSTHTVYQTKILAWIANTIGSQVDKGAETNQFDEI